VSDRSLVGQIRYAVRQGEFLVSAHARLRLSERKIALWQVEAGLERGKIIEVRPDDEPNPSIVVEEMLPDGAVIHVVRSWLAATERAKLVTVFPPEKS
jgi:hypothetical protein